MQDNVTNNKYLFMWITFKIYIINVILPYCHPHTSTACFHCPSTDEWLSTSESYAPTSKWTSPSPSELTTEAPERSSQPHSTTIATAWSSQSAGTGDDNTDVLDSKGQKGGTATASDPLTDPTLQPNRVRPVSWG